MFGLESDRQRRSSITKDLRYARRAVIRAELCLPKAWAELEQYWKKLIIKKGDAASAAAAAEAAMLPADVTTSVGPRVAIPSGRNRGSAKLD